MKRYFLIFLVVISMAMAACESSVHFFGTPVSDEERWEAEEETVRIELAIEKLMYDPSEPVMNLNSDPRLACSAGKCVMCDDSPRKSECTNSFRELITLSNSPGEGANQVKPLAEYLQTDTSECFYCVYPDGKLECFLEDGANLNDL